MTDRVARLRQASLDAKPWISMERAALVTGFLRDAPPLSAPQLRARALAHHTYHHRFKTLFDLLGLH